MRTPPSTPPNKYTSHIRLAECEVVASNALQGVKELTARFDRQPPQGLKGDTGPAGLSITGPAGRDGKDGKDGVGYSGINGTNGRDGKDGGPGPDSAAVLAQAQQTIADLHARMDVIERDFNTLSLAFTSSARKSQEYLDFLRARAAARQGAKQ